MTLHRVLVVDDSSTIRHLLTFALRQDGYEVTALPDGTEALARIHELEPELVITDAVMPGLSGYDLCRELRQDSELSQPHVIMVTDSGQDVDRERAEQAGVDEFVTKPFSPSLLRARVREILDNR
jgi:DNA-binding response OmpR family regulator